MYNFKNDENIDIEEGVLEYIVPISETPAPPLWIISLTLFILLFI